MCQHFLLNPIPPDLKLVLYDILNCPIYKGLFLNPVFCPKTMF